MDDSTRKELENFAPLSSFNFGHTRTQVEHFKGLSYQGSPKLEYWNHVLQLRALKQGVEDAQIELAELEHELEQAAGFWPPWGKAERQRKLPRLQVKKRRLEQGIRERERELSVHWEIIKTRYQHLTHLTEEEILAEERLYWVQRLSRQMATAHVARALGVPEGELQAVLALPAAEQRQILDSVRSSLAQLSPLLVGFLPPTQQQRENTNDENLRLKQTASSLEGNP